MNTQLALRQALEAIAQLTDPEPPWRAVLESARRLVGGDSATLALVDGSGALLMFHQSGANPDAERDYVDHFHAQDIVLPKARNAGTGEWLDTHELFSAHTLSHNAYYVDFMCRHRMRQMLTLMVGNSTRHHGGLSFQRATPVGHARLQLEGAAVRAFNHALQQALARRHRTAQRWMEGAASGHAAFDETLCVATRSGCIAWLSPAGEQRLLGGSPLQVRSGRLWHPDAPVRAGLALALAHATGPDADAGHTPVQLNIPDRQGQRTCHLEFAPADARLKLGDESMVLVRIQCRPASHAVSAPALCAAFGITPAEARVLAALMAGESASAHAKAHSVSVHTVRKQIATLMDKMDCTRQVDLVRCGLSVQ